MHFFIPTYQVYHTYVRAEIQPHLLVCFHSDMRSVVSLSRVVEYLCLAFPGPSTIDFDTQRPITRAFEREYRPNRRAEATGELKQPGAQRPRWEPVTILSWLGVLACVLGFCLHGFISSASIYQRLRHSFSTSNMALYVLFCTMVRELAQFSSCRERLPPDCRSVLPSLKLRG